MGRAAWAGTNGLGCGGLGSDALTPDLLVGPSGWLE